jgi:hypothetical protein
MDQSCPVVHKSRRPQARLQTAKLFCNNCVLTQLRTAAIFSLVNLVTFFWPGVERCKSDHIVVQWLERSELRDKFIK